MKKALSLMVGLSLALAGTAVAGLKIGVVGPHSGDLAPYGLPTKDAAEMYIAKVNAAGGVLGQPVELVAMDDQCKPEVAASVATKVVSEKVNIVIGHVCSGATKAAMGIYKEANIIAISPASTNPPLTLSGDYPNFFRTIAPDNEQGKLAATFVVKTLGAKKVALIHDKGDYGKGFIDFAREYLKEMGVKDVLYEGVQPGAMDYSAVIQKVRRTDADVVIFGGYHPEASKLVAVMKQKRVKAAFVGPDGIKGNGFLDLAGATAEGVYATGPKDVSQVPMNMEARAEYVKAKGAEPGTFWAQGLSAIQAAVAAVAKAGNTDYAAVSNALRTNMVDTAIGTIKFDAKGDAEGAGFAVYQVHQGQFAEVK